MKIAVMQPYLFPYIGYFQLIKSVDIFVLYDDIQYTKKGWINRNRFLNLKNEPEYFSLPLKKDSDYLNINQRYLSSDYLLLNKKTLRTLDNAYRKAPNYKEIFPLVEEIFTYNSSTNLFDFLFNSLNLLIKQLEIKTKIVKSSDIESDYSKTLKKENRIIQICNELNATNYINPIGGLELYDKIFFANNNIELNFLKSDDIKYNQFSHDFVKWLSILDVLMFCSKNEIDSHLSKYSLI